MDVKCTDCGESKPATIAFFHAHPGGKNGLRTQCKACKNAKQSASRKSPEAKAMARSYAIAYGRTAHGAERKRLSARNNPNARAASKKWKAEHREQVRAADKLWREKNVQRVRDTARRAAVKLQQRPDYVLKKRIKARLRQMLKGLCIGSTEKILGYTKAQLVAHVELQFTRGMTWGCLMRGDIHLDHIVPVSAFAIREVGDGEFRACWSLANLRPMWAKDNQQKADKILTLL